MSAITYSDVAYKFAQDLMSPASHTLAGSPKRSGITLAINDFIIRCNERGYPISQEISDKIRAIVRAYRIVPPSGRYIAILVKQLIVLCIKTIFENDLSSIKLEIE